MPFDSRGGLLGGQLHPRILAERFSQNLEVVRGVVRTSTCTNVARIELFAELSQLVIYARAVRQ